MVNQQQSNITPRGFDLPRHGILTRLRVEDMIFPLVNQALRSNQIEVVTALLHHPFWSRHIFSLRLVEKHCSMKRMPSDKIIDEFLLQWPPTAL